MERAALPIAHNAAADGNRPRESALATLTAVMSHLDSAEDVPAFFGRLSATAATLTRARRAAFWRLGPGGTLSLQPAPHGFASDSAVHRPGLRVAAGSGGVIARMLFGESLEPTRGTSAVLDAVWRRAGLTDVESSIAAGWRAGDRRFGVIAVYDAGGGFAAHEQWVLRMVGLAAGLVWRQRESEDELARTASRLEQAMGACRHLLYSIAAGGDEARRRFASALHDDSLQLLTAAELQLERLRTDTDAGAREAHIEQLRRTLGRIEDSLRRLLISASAR